MVYPGKTPVVLLPNSTPSAYHWYKPSLSGKGVTLIAGARLNGEQAVVGLEVKSALESGFTVIVIVLLVEVQLPLVTFLLK